MVHWRGVASGCGYGVVALTVPPSEYEKDTIRTQNCGNMRLSDKQFCLPSVSLSKGDENEQVMISQHTFAAINFSILKVKGWWVLFYRYQAFVTK